MDVKRKTPIIDFKEIKNADEFENLTAAFFRALDKKGINVQVDQSGIGADSGRDILVSFTLNDRIHTLKRKWVVQCKFYSKAINKSNLADINIPTLIHQFGANGYLLVCKNAVTSKLSEMFEDLNKNCKLGYSYKIWTGSEFIKRLYSETSLHKQYFPKYYEALNKIKKK